MKRSKELSRRDFLASTGMAAAGATLFPFRALTSPARIRSTDGPYEIIMAAAAVAKIDTHPLRGGIYVLEGSGGNIAAVPGKDGKLLIDAGISVSKPQVSAALNAINDDPIKHLINTHWHFDHTSGNAWLHEAGASICAHVNTRKHMAKTTRVDDWQHTFPASPAAALPVTTFTSEKTVQLNGKTIRLHYYGPAHTDCDICVHFQEDDVLHVADTWWNGLYPFIDYNTGGSIDGMIHATAKNIGLTTDKTSIICGHGPLGSRADMIEYHDMLTHMREKVAGLKRKGLSLQETVAAKPSREFDPKWGQNVIGPDLFVRLVYKGV